MILDERREGGVQTLKATDPRLRIPAFWRGLDRNISLGAKLIIPAIAITLIGTCGLGLIEAQQTNHQVEATYETAASGAANAAATAFYNTISHPEGVDAYLGDLVTALPGVQAIWIVNLVGPGQPVVASSNPGDIGKTGVFDPVDVETVENGRTSYEQHVIGGQQMLETVVPVKGNAYGVMVMTSLAGEDEIYRSKVISSLIVAILICALEVAAMVILLEAGTLRRIRRVSEVVDLFGKTVEPVRLSEGLEPAGRDALFNLARSIDHKLQELAQHERADTVVADLGRLALEGVDQVELTRKALEITRQAGDLERCFLVDARGQVTIIQSATEGDATTTAAKLPIWLGALVRAAAQGRRPVLTEGLGQGSRYWEADEGAPSGAAVFVPLAGTPNPIGVMVGVARTGTQVSAVTVSMMEAVATALGESLQRTNAEKARHESDAKSKALHTVSHEIRNPLNAMLGFNELLLSGAAGSLTEEQQSYVRKVDEASRHMLRLVNDYLDLAKVMSGALPVQHEDIVVAKEVSSVVDLLRPTADAKRVKLHAEVSASVVARADRTRLRQVLMNLVSNAVKFTPANGHVRVEVAGGSNGVRISVIDTGVGIPADRQHLVFTEFAQLGPSNGEGTGLGLALTKRLVEAMGGFIRFTSAEGAGTIFDVWLPGDQSPVAAATPLQTAGAA